MVLVLVRVDVKHLAQRPQKLMVKQHETKQRKMCTSVKLLEMGGDGRIENDTNDDREGLAHRGLKIS